MDFPELEEALRNTFEDRQLSRSEKHALEQVLAEFDHDEGKLRFIRNRAFDIAREAVSGQDAHSALEWLEKVIRVVDNQRRVVDALEISSYFTPGDDCKDCLLAEMAACKDLLDICVYTITDNRITAGIITAYDRGVKVRIITDDEKMYDPGSDIRRLADHGIPIAVDGVIARMHHKYAVFDKKRVATGSFNWTRSASAQNYENVVLTNEEKLVANFSEEFERLWVSLDRVTL